MAILEEEVWVTLSSANIYHYESLKYDIPRKADKRGRMTLPRGTEIKVRVEDLTQGSNNRLTKVCDLCGKHVKDQIYSSIRVSREKSSDGLDKCAECHQRGSVIAEVDEEFAKLFWNKEDAYKYAPQSRNFADFKCPHCGVKVENKRIQSVYRNGVSCDLCSDGISYPEKFMFNLLLQLNIDFDFHEKFNWSNNKEYDFYIKDLNCIIETHGSQHYKEAGFNSVKGKSLVEVQENDYYKKDIAIENGIENYIVIDSRVSELEFMKESIITNDNFIELFNLDSVDWMNCHTHACSTIVRKTCDLWNNGIKSTSEISKKLKIEKSTVRNHLKKGSKIGWCDYNPEKSKRDKSNQNKEVVQIDVNGKYINTYSSIKIASENFDLNSTSISGVCNNRRKTAGGFIWMFKSDYDAIKNNDGSIEIMKESEPKIIQLDFNMNFVREYDDLNEASNIIKSNGAKGNLKKCCEGKVKSAYGYKWMYKEDYLKYDEREIKELNSRPVIMPRRDLFKTKRVVNIDTGLEFESIGKASEHYNLDNSSLSKCCKGKSETCGGFKWMYKEDYE